MDIKHGFSGGDFMSLALEEARLGGVRGEVPVGAVIVDSSGVLVSSSGNRVEELRDPTAHAELLAIRLACSHLGSRHLVDCDLYVTLEPCSMCAGAISLSRIRRLYYGAWDEKGGGVLHGARIFSSSGCHHVPEIYDGIMEFRCSQLLREFFILRR